MAIRSLKESLQAAGAAFQLLTRIPIPVQIPFTREVLARSVLFYPLVGLIVGLITALAGWLLAYVLPAWPAAVLTLLVWIALTGALHLDGLMDTADGVLSHRSREKMLEIMKDSRVGAMGVIAAILLLLLKASLIAQWLGESDLRPLLPHLVTACMWGRLWMVGAMLLWPNARGNEGLGGMFAGLPKRQLAYAGLLHVVLAGGVYAVSGTSWQHGALYLLTGAVITAFVGGGVAMWLNAKLGGLTGDTYGTMNEIVETVLLLAAVAIFL
ncbi:cobalamin 5'-phosphate synthase/cobalamin synthase [Paenibacillus phyllosphaerae]|uniref:Adenosylcobinamide-GDP ribazoletransferase n=1 Tax=Paenibacillus phyllosphaerae TaxID=274593 RepID=A0A7W5AWQ2_9BACL|nr:adenosylcobinamide-GDP ribazoletransferase [Paenibacillus phyllosphaerae]MBB3109491.1 cobalamin 5'-phosphate synthase/cobalamin synthase [Paenibacillus phyllosphaerae]